MELSVSDININIKFDSGVVCRIDLANVNVGRVARTNVVIEVMVRVMVRY